MPDVPTVFNRIDFIGILSQGYVAALLWIIIFYPKFLAGNPAISYDVISAVIFVVAGPALGLTLIRIHHGITSFIHHFPLLIYKPPKNSSLAKRYEGSSLQKRYKSSMLGKRVQKYEDCQGERDKYAMVRLGLSEDQRLELDLPESFTDFEASVGVALIGIVVYGVLTPFLMNTPYDIRVYFIGSISGRHPLLYWCMA